MQILHLSDTHGAHFWKVPIPTGTDVVCHTGDFFPNRTRGITAIEEQFQTDWLNTHKAALTNWLGSVPLVYVPGNHDYVELNDFIPCHRINANGFDLLGFKWFGFREIPFIVGEWNGETRAPELAAIVDKVMGETGDILVTHTPPAGILALQYGCDSLASQLFYRQHTYRYHLFGHTHLQNYSQLTENNILFSNGAVWNDEDSWATLRGGLVQII